MAVVQTIVNMFLNNEKLTAGVQGNVKTDLGKVNFSYSANI